jgi:hypothetical protein
MDMAILSELKVRYDLIIASQTTWLSLRKNNIIINFQNRKHAFLPKLIKSKVSNTNQWVS